jgi:hypothetical protein
LNPGPHFAGFSAARAKAARNLIKIFSNCDSSTPQMRVKLDSKKAQSRIEFDSKRNEAGSIAFPIAR